MDYEDCKELRDAGFPQGIYDPSRDGEHYMYRETDDIPENNRTMWARYYKQEFLESRLDELVLVPTLSELIEACGDSFESLEYVKKGTEHVSNTEWLERDGRWLSVASDSDGTTIEDKSGNTPEQAVKNLWIALKK